MKQKGKQGEFLLEIGTEELPSPFLDYLKNIFELTQFTKTLLAEILQETAVVENYQTPRRIIYYIRGLRNFFEKEERISGPRKGVCYGPDGKPTKALEGFLKRYKATVNEVVEENGRIIIRRKVRKLTRHYLKEKVPLLISVGFLKRMRWDESPLSFPRPIRWILCLYNDQILNFSQGRLQAGRETHGLGFHSTQKSIRNSGEYFKFLKKEGILLEICSPEKEGQRKLYIREQLKRQLAKIHGSPDKINESLLGEVANLVEKPVLFSGHFDKKYLNLPKEILGASMSKYQRIFSVENRSGELLPYFVACANGSPSLARVRKNYEQVLNARLEDADFFFEEDTQEDFSRKREKLRLLVYHQKLGTMYDKSERMRQMAECFSQRLGVREKELLRSCELAKNDLVTEMVKEFPSLQGVVGYYYARRGGEGEEVALAIREQYLDLPKSPLGSALAFLERLDHLVGCFCAGETPTGSSDPYALRRAGSALFQILLHQGWSFPLEEMVEENRRLFVNVPSSPETSKRLLRFLLERLKAIFREKGYREDLIEAVVQKVDEGTEAQQKLSSLKGMMEGEPDHFWAAFKVVERTHNILRPLPTQERQTIGPVKPDLFEDEIEKTLWKVYNNEKDPIVHLIGKGAWDQATLRYGRSFVDILHQFFEKVLVNVEDREIRRNRLAMMREINELYTKSVADLSKLMIQGEGKAS